MLGGDVQFGDAAILARVPAELVVHPLLKYERPEIENPILLPLITPLGSRSMWLVAEVDSAIEIFLYTGNTLISYCGSEIGRSKPTQDLRLGRDRSKVSSSSSQNGVGTSTDRETIL